MIILYRLWARYHKPGEKCRHLNFQLSGHFTYPVWQRSAGGQRGPDNRGCTVSILHQILLRMALQFMWMMKCILTFVTVVTTRRQAEITTVVSVFFQVFSRTSALGKNSKLPNIDFTMKHSGNNSASSVIFGGLLDRCIPDPRRAEIVTSLA